MKNKPTANLHPDYDQLVGIVTNPGFCDSLTENHVATCNVCQHEIVSIRNMISHLKSVQPVVENNPHLSDEQINEYVYGRLDAAETEKINNHLQHCANCKKEVLLLQTAIMQAKLSREANNNVQPIKQKPVSYRFSQFVSLSAAASVLLAVTAYLIIGTSKFSPESTPQNTELTAGITTMSPLNPQDSSSSDNILPASLSNKGYQSLKNGVIDWYNGYVETVAVGTVDMSKTVNPVQAEIIAEKSARATAYAQIAEILGGVQITQSSTYNDLLLKVDNLVVESNSFIRNAQVIESKIEWLKEVPKATVKMRVPLYGNYSIESIVTPHIEKASKQQAMRAAFNNDQWSKAGLAQYTGVVVDARNTDYQPTLLLNLRPNSENVAMLQNVQAAYYSSVQNSKNNSAVGSNPYVIKADPSSQKGEIVLDLETLKELISILTHSPSSEQMAVLY